MKRIKSACLALLMVLLSPMAANAVPITWELVDWTFNDGGTASGEFTFDADTGLYSDIFITTTAGGSFAGTEYTVPNPFSPGNSIILIVVTELLADLTGTPVLAVSWLTDLTNDGGTVGIDFSGFDSEGSCANGCTGLAAVRTLVAGRIESVPEPGTLSLLGLGLFGMALARRRRKV